MKNTSHIPTVVFALLLASTSVHAQTQRTFNNTGSGNNWSTPGNWSGNNIANGNGDWVQVNANGPNVDTNRTVNFIQSNFGHNGDYTVSGGLLTIDINRAPTSHGIRNVSGQSVSNFIFSGSVDIKNSGSGLTTFTFSNSSGKDSSITFSSGSSLTLSTLTRTVEGSGGTINFNGTFASSAADLQIATSKTVFGTGHDSTAFGRDFVLLDGSTLTINDGTVLNSGRKFQVNGNAGLVLNGADTINGANLVIAGSNTLTLGANADQDNLGFLNLENGGLVLDLDAAVSNFSFADTSAQTWGTGSVTINGFRPNVIRFGTDDSGLTAGQLSVIDGGAYTLDSQGYLIPEPGTLILVSVFGIAVTLLCRRRR